MSAKPINFPQMSGTVDFQGKVEIIDSDELAKRLKVPSSWVRNHCQPRVPEADRIPRLQFGRYLRFRWGSPELERWIAARITK
jgi:hypothetical protein